MTAINSENTSIEAEVSPLDESNAPAHMTADVVELPKGRCLAIKEAERVLRANDTRTHAVIGPTGSGKTSLISAVYESFQKSARQVPMFARSTTLAGFELACHDSRAASRRAEPETEHTPHNPLPYGVSFYHLGVVVRDRLLDLLIADRTGEDYKSAADDLDVCSDFVEVRRADCLTLLIDGARLIDLGARHNVRSEAALMIQALVDADQVRTDQQLIVVLTKLDLIEGSAAETKERALRDFTSIVENLRTLFGTHFDAIHAQQTAASPKSSILPHAFGIPELFQVWTGHSSSDLRCGLPIDTHSEVPGRSMQRIRVLE